MENINKDITFKEKLERNGKKIFIKGTLIIFGILLAFLLGEAAIRIIDPPPKMLKSLNIRGYILSDNPVLKYECKPGYIHNNAPYDSAHRNFLINSAGFRDYEFPEIKVPGVIRIITLGDSITAGNGITNIIKIYPKQLETFLNQNASQQKYEVLNMAVGGYHTLQEVETLRVKGLKYKPDIVVIGFCLNDFSLTSDGAVYQRLIRELKKEKKNTLGRIYRTYGKWSYFLLSKSRLLFFLYHRMFAGKSEHSFEFEYRRDVLKGQNPVEVGFELLNRLQEEHGFKSYIFIIPAFEGRFSNYAHRKIHKKVLNIASQFPALQVIDLLNDFASINPDGRVFSYDFVHPNEYGHRILAELIIPRITQRPKKDLKNIITNYPEKTKVNLVNARVYFQQGISLEKQGKFQEAVKKYSKVIQITPDYMPAYFNRGNVFFRLGKFNEAIADYKQALKIKPDFVEAHNNFGFVLEKQGKLKEAIAHYSEAIRINSNYNAAKNNLIRAQKSLKMKKP